MSFKHLILGAFKEVYFPALLVKGVSVMFITSDALMLHTIIKQ